MNIPAQIVTRREALRTAALGALVLPVIGSAAAAEKKQKAPEAALPTYATFPEGRENGLRLGVASYSLRNLPLDEFISTVKVLRISNVALFRLHCNWEGAPVEECRTVGDKLKAAGLRLTGSGVVNLPNDEAKCRQAFENVKAAGMATMVCKPDVAAGRIPWRDGRRAGARRRRACTPSWPCRRPSRSRRPGGTWPRRSAN